MQNMRRQRDRGRRIALRGFRDDLRLRNFRQLADDLIAHKIVRQDPDSLRRNHRGKTIDAWPESACARR